MTASPPAELTLPAQAETFIPHRLPMRLIDTLISCDGTNGVVEAVVPADGILVADDGTLEAVALAEMLAQSYAALRGYADTLNKQPVREGFLVGIKSVEFVEPVRAGDRLRISLRTVATVEGFAVVEGEVLREAQTVATGSLKLWIPEGDGEVSA